MRMVMTSNVNPFFIRAQQRQNGAASSLLIPKKNEISDNPFQKRAQQRKAEEENAGLVDTSKDVAQQIVAKGAQGILGSYGNILDTFGLQSKENLLPGQKANLESAYNDEYDLGLNDEILPNYARLPSSKQAKEAVELTTGIGEGKTPSGRIVGRGAEFAGEGLATGGGVKTLLTLAGAGATGQGLREMGAPESLASGAEIAGSILPSLISGKVNPRSQEAQKIVNAGRTVSLTEKQIAPLIQGEGKVSFLSKIARKSDRTKKTFANIKASLGDSYQNIKTEVAKLPKINNKNQNLLYDKFTSIREELSKTLKASPDKESAIKFIDDAISKLSNHGASPEELINFWQDINKSVPWNKIDSGKKTLSQLKEPILEVLSDVAPQAAKDFEMTNLLYSKYAQISKKLKPDIVDSFINKAEVMAFIPAGLSLVYGNVAPLAGLATESALRILGREMLINPYFMNLGHKLQKNFNQASFKGVKDLVNNAKELLEEKHPDEDWNFLVQD